MMGRSEQRRRVERLEANEDEGGTVEITGMASLHEAVRRRQEERGTLELPRWPEARKGSGMAAMVFANWIEDRAQKGEDAAAIIDALGVPEAVASSAVAGAEAEELRRMLRADQPNPTRS